MPEPDPIAVALNGVEDGLADYHYSLEARVRELSAENAALREFVTASDVFQQQAFRPADGAWWDRCKHPDEQSQRMTQARKRLATDYGIPLPGQEGEG